MKNIPHELVRKRRPEGMGRVLSSIKGVRQISLPEPSCDLLIIRVVVPKDCVHRSGTQHAFEQVV